MILPNVRERITSADRDLVLKLLARGNAARRARFEARMRAEGEDSLLDESGLFELLHTAPGLAAPSAPLYFYVAVRHHLRDLGIDDATLSDYLGALLLEFGLRDRAYRIAPVDDARYEYVADVVADLEIAQGRRGFLLRAHLGNFSLWLAGVFPDYIAARRVKGGPDLQYYETVGSRGFQLAAAHTLAQEYGLDDVFDRLADAFERIRVGLNRLSDTCFFPGVGGPDRLLRQVGDQLRFGLDN
jgi:hypothetical protein